MADRGPGPPQLILKRIEAEQKRLEHSISQQELELMEMGERQQRLLTNIEASRKALADAQHTYQVTQEQYAEELGGNARG